MTVLWRHLLGVDPNPIQLDFGGYLQHGPDRSVQEAFRGFAKSWITGGFGLWTLDRDPDSNILLVSGSLTRAAASTNWMLQLIHSWPLLQHLIPKPNQRQSSKMFDVGPARESQSASVFSLGIGGQIVGFRGSLIIPDDVETQQNSITAPMREKIAEAVKEFDSVLLPPILGPDGLPREDVIQPAIKYLGTPHDTESLYNELPKRGYGVRIWPALYPTPEQVKAYGPKLAPYILRRLEKDPGLVGTSTMPNRFTDDDLARRRLSLGQSEFALQFMLDTTLADRDKYPLKTRDLMVMALDPRRGPEAVTWSDDPAQRLRELPNMGFAGDFYHAPIVPEGVSYAPWNRVVGGVDNSGRGSDETALTIVAELHGVLFVLAAWADRAGFEPPTLQAIADRCVQFRVQQLLVEENFGGGMFTALLGPVLVAAWAKHNAAQRRAIGTKHEDGGTEIVEVKASNQMNKERRLLAMLEPVTQQHRLVVNRAVIEWDQASLAKKEGEDTRHRYSLWHQYTHLTRERESLIHDDRLDSLGIAVSGFADILGVDPGLMAARAGRERTDDELLKLFGEMEDDEMGVPRAKARGSRATGLGPSAR